MNEQPPPERRPVRTSAVPPKPKRPSLAIYKITPGQEHDLIILSTRVTGVLTHFDGTRTGPCTGDSPATCEYHGKYKVRWQGWIACRRIRVQEIRLACLTPTAVYACPALKTNERSLRGARLVVGRAGNSVRSRMGATVQFDGNLATTLLPEPDMIEQLYRMWEAPLRPETLAKIGERSRVLTIDEQIAMLDKLNAPPAEQRGENGPGFVPGSDNLFPY